MSVTEGRDGNAASLKTRLSLTANHHKDESKQADRFKTVVGRGGETRDSSTMLTQPYHLYVERIDPARNMARFYTLAIEPMQLTNCSTKVNLQV